MQNKEIIGTDTRTFGQIWATLSSSQRDDLSIEIYKSRLCQTRQTINNWVNGRSRPAVPLIKDRLAQLVSRTIGSRVIGDTLFPQR